MADRPRDKEFGGIAPDYVFDLILVDGDPTLNISDIRKMRTVIRGGSTVRLRCAVEIDGHRTSAVD